ncbi:MAG: DHH family phosphoesterase [Deltaproteobacteria bacterium]|nr:DHH family phosphoesterase [Deltaproteobacteria bacterium]
MENPFPKSVTVTERVKKLLETVSFEDTLAILINADPDSMACATALKRLFWRRVKKTDIYHINIINRADNLAMIKFLKVDLKHIRKMDASRVTKWAIVDSQPHHSEQFMRYKFDIIVDHHPANPGSKGQFVDIRDDYGATSTMFTEYLRASGIKPSPKLATALFYGIKTDTDDFVRNSAPNDINAFRYLYQFVNNNIIKKIESSGMTKKTLSSYRTAIENIAFFKDISFIYMDKVENPDILVMIADFFLKMVETTWSVVSGIHNQKLIIIIRNAGFRLNAGYTAERLFGAYGSAGGHKNAARVEIPLKAITQEITGKTGYRQFVMDKFKKA